MSGTDEQSSPRGSRGVLVGSTVVMAAAAAAMLALGTQDARLLRLGLVAALWAALLGAFATARVPSEIVQLRTELAAMRAKLEQLLGGDPLVERVTPRAEYTPLLPLPAHPRSVDDSRSRAAAASLTGPEPRFGPIRLTPVSGSSPSSAPDVAVNGHGRHGVPGREWPASTHNTATSAQHPSKRMLSPQRTVDDLLAANGRNAVPRRGST